MTKTSPQGTTPPTAQIYFFQIYAHNRPDLYHQDYPLFNNMRQQLFITARITGINVNGVVSPLTQEELNSIRLIDYDTAEVLPFENPAYEWTYSHTANGYIWDPKVLNSINTLQEQQPELFSASNATPALPDEMEAQALRSELSYTFDPGSAPFSPTEREHLAPDVADYQYVTFLLSTRATTSRRVAAKVVLELGNVEIRTNHREIDNDFGLGENGKFNSSIRIIPKTFPRLPDTCYGTRDSANPNFLRQLPVVSHPKEEGTHVMEQHINIRLPDQTYIPIHYVFYSEPTANIIYADKGSNDEVGTSHTYIADLGERYIHYPIPPYIGTHGSFPSSHRFINEAFFYGLSILPRAINIIDGEITIGHVMTKHDYWFYTQPWAYAQSKLSTTIRFMDVYGNEHGVILAFQGTTTFNRLTLARA